VKPKPAHHVSSVAVCLHEFGQCLVAPRLQILEIFWVIGAEPHHHGKVADLGGDAIDILSEFFAVVLVVLAVVGQKYFLCSNVNFTFMIT